LRLAHLHTDMEQFDVHVALDVCESFAADTAASTVCESVIESATSDAEIWQCVFLFVHEKRPALTFPPSAR